MNRLKIIILGLLLSVVLSRIFTIDPAKELIGDFGDKYEFFTYMYIIRDNLIKGNYPLLRSDILRYPVGFELDHGSDGVFASFTGALLGIILPLPLAYNLTMVLILFLNFYLTFLFFKKFSNSLLFGIFAGIFFGFSPFVMARINGHANLSFIGGFSLFALALFNIYKKVELKSKFSLLDFTLFFSGVVLIAFGSLQYLIIIFWFSVFFITAFFLIYPIESLSYSASLIRGIKNALNGKILPFIFSLLFFIFIVLFFYSGFIRGFISGSFVYPYKYWKYVTCCLPQMSDLVIPNQFAGKIWSIINKSPSSIERVITLGIVEWLIVLYALIIESNIYKKIAWILVFGIYLITSLGMVTLPFWPEGGRSIVILSLISLILVSNNNFIRNNKIVTFLIIVLIFERIYFKVYKTETFPSEVGKIVSKESSSAVLNIPLSGSHAYRSFLTYIYQKKIIDGYFHDTAENEASLSFLSQSLLERYFCNYEKLNPDILNFKENDYEKSLELLRSWDIKTIVIHKNLIYEKYYYDDCFNVRYWWFNINPETIFLDKSTSEETITTKSLYKYPMLKTKIYFKTGGIFKLNGVFIANESFDDAKISFKNKFIINPDWIKENGGLKTSFQNPLEENVNPRDEITIYSDKIHNDEETIYITLYYSFVVDNSRPIAPPIENIYLSNDFEIYRVN